MFLVARSVAGSCEAHKKKKKKRKKERNKRKQKQLKNHILISLFPPSVQIHNLPRNMTTPISKTQNPNSKKLKFLEGVCASFLFFVFAF
jgi:hypothetical protein